MPPSFEPDSADTQATDAELTALRLDHDRERRCGFPEVVFGAGKTTKDLVAAAEGIWARHDRLLITRIDAAGAAAVADRIGAGGYHERARCYSACREPVPRAGAVSILCAGTSDVAVAEEARITAEISGSATQHYYDVGVAGVHRLLSIRDELEEARVLVVVAGMEGALPSVVAGLVSRPVIAVPTSVGYGAAFGGIAALLGMLNSCANGISVVNIDNGFGAGMLASRINLLPPLQQDTQ
ncbi:MAG: nickel pincer cofactor biosynthesis protein LarB [Planctomycetota bacterium]